MKVFRAATVLALLTVGPALAQMKPPAPSDPPASPSEREYQKSTDSAYKKSLGNIPDQPAADPWGGAHAVDPPKSTTSAPAPTKRTKASTGTTPN
jgi:hypothetical protein